MSHRTTIVVPDQLASLGKQLADFNNRSFTAEILVALRDHINQATGTAAAFRDRILFTPENQARQTLHPDKYDILVMLVEALKEGATIKNVYGVGSEPTNKIVISFPRGNSGPLMNASDALDAIKRFEI